MTTQSFEDMMKTWTESQKKMWDSFFETMQGLGKSQSAQVWERTISMGEQAFKNTFKTQSEWIQNWVKEMSAMEGVPAQAQETAKQFQKMYEQWSETQARLWVAWFDMLKKFDPSKGIGAWSETSPSPFQAWQDSTQKVMETQIEWMRSWMGQVGKKSDE